MFKLILFFLTATVAHAILSEPPGLPDDWKAPHYKVFGNNVSAISPEETYETLVQLINLYQGRTDELSNTRRLRAEALVNEKRLGSDRCCQESFDHISRLMSFHSVNKINVIPYLKKIKFERSMFCQKKFASDIASAVHQLELHYKLDIIEMIATIHNSHEEYNNHMEMFTPRQNLVDGIIEYMNHHLGDLRQNGEISGRFGRRKLGQLFKVNVASLCSKVDEVILPKANIYKRLMYDDELMREVDKMTKDWVMRAFVCQDIIWKSDSLVDEIYRKIIEGTRKIAAEEQKGKEKKKRGFNRMIKSLVKSSSKSKS